MSGIVVSTRIVELRERLGRERAAGRSIGFVPTMGALHEGHDSLVRRAVTACDVAVASIFVNPLQFGPDEDYERYPRPLDVDLERLRGLGCHHLWHPGVEEMYPPGFATRIEMAGLVEGLCGRSRPGHFSGVLTVVLKLLEQVRPDVAFFGQKDFQQARAIQRMVQDLYVPVLVEIRPTVREPDGLAVSSRNRYLSPEERAEAPALREALLAVDRSFWSGVWEPARLLDTARAVLSRRQRIRVDYLELVDPDELRPRADAAREGDLVAVAAFLGEARLIDNLLLAREPLPTAPQA